MKLTDFDFRIWDNKNKFYLNSMEVDSSLTVPTLAKHKNFKSSVFIEFSSNSGSSGFNIINSISEENNQENIEDIEIELWTGFYDRNGIKIYENDILEDKALEELYHITRSDSGNMFKIAIYTTNAFEELYERKAKPDISFLKTFKSERNMEIIGNIHENEDLLKESNV